MKIDEIIGDEFPDQPTSQPSQPMAAPMQPPAQPAAQQPVMPTQPQPVPSKQKLLVIVHPGSACGSADFNLGRYSARASRDYLADDIVEWEGAVLVIDGQLSDELPNYPALNESIKEALNQAHVNGQIALRLYGDDDVPPHQEDTARKFIKQQKLNPAEWEIELTGAWMSGDSGCVRGVWEVFQRAGFKADVRDSALWLEEEDDWESEREDDM